MGRFPRRYFRYQTFQYIFLLVLLLSACGVNQGFESPGTSTMTGVSPSALESNLPVPNNTGKQAGFGAKIKFKRISLDQGLSQSIVYDVVQDPYGLVWIGTWDGLNRYDGYSFKVYKNNPDDPNSLINNSIRDLYVDLGGTLWIGTDQGFCQYDRQNDRFVCYQHNLSNPESLSHNSVGRILEDTSGQLWIGTWGGGLNRFNRETGQFIHYKNDPSDPGSLSSNTVWDIFEDKSGELWVGTWNGLDRLERASGKFIHYRNNPANPDSLSSNLVRSIHEDRSGRLWIGTNGEGVDVMDRSSGKFSHYKSNADDPNTLSDNKVWMVYEDDAGSTWVATNNGLNQYLEKTGQFIRYLFNVQNPDDPESLSNPVIYSIYQDRSGLYWLGTGGGGLNQFSSSTNRFLHFRHDPDSQYSLSNNFVWSIYEDRDGVLWVGTSYGLNRYSRQENRFKHYVHEPGNASSLSHSGIKSIYQDRAGNLWVGTDSGLNLYDSFKKTFVPYRLPFTVDTENIQNQTRDLSEVPVWAITEDSEGKIWLGTGGLGLLRLDPKSRQLRMYNHSENKPTSISGDDVISVLVDDDGSLWVGTMNRGLNHFLPATGRFDRFINNPVDPNSLSDNTVLSILKDQSGILWLGTLGGLNKYDPASANFTRYRGKNGLPSDVVYGVMQDDREYLWMSTNAGISRLDPVTETFKNFNYRDGLQSNEFNSGAYFKGMNGEMYFGGVNGFNEFQPGQIIDNPYIPPVVLTAIKQNGEPIKLPGPVESVQEVSLLWPKNYFEFEYAALSYIQPEDNQYAYMLEGFDSQWNYIGTRRDGRYTNLPGGSYTLRLKASNNDGVWNEEGRNVKVTVVPPAWENPWVQWGSVLAVLIALFVGYRLRISGIQKHNEQLAVQVAERTKEIEQRRQVAEGLRDILVLLNSNKMLEESLDFIVHQVRRLIKGEKVCLFQANDGARPRVIAMHSAGLQDETLCNGKPPGEMDCPVEVLEWFVELANEGKTQVIENLPRVMESLNNKSQNWPGDFQTLVILPIAPSGHVFGGLAILFCSPKTFPQEELDLLNSFADQAELAIGNAQLRSKAEELAVVSERNRLARDLHDAVTQTLFSASLIAEALPTLWENDKEEGVKLLGELRQLNRGALAEMRSLLMELRPSAVVDARLPDLLHQLAEAVTGRTGVEVNLELPASCNLPHDVHIGLYRIAQEALTNVTKHAHASQVSLRLYCEPLEKSLENQGETVKIYLVVKDNGVGFEPEKVLPDHFGLMNIRERAQAIGARLEINSRVGKGTQVKVEWQGKVLGHDR